MWTPYDEDILRAGSHFVRLLFLRLLFLRLLSEPMTGILLCGILFSPRTLLPGQMHTNAFRSPKDKEWTRFSHGSNVS